MVLLSVLVPNADQSESNIRLVREANIEPTENGEKDLSRMIDKGERYHDVFYDQIQPL